jgi:hypothetical protein
MVLAEILLVSRLLGLVAGEQRLDIQVDTTVKRVEVWRDGQNVQSLRKPPWITAVNFGPELAPHDVTVVAFDADGHELGRDSQAVNVSRPPAELGVLLQRDAAGKLTAAIRWAHFAYRAPMRLTVKLDGHTISRKKVSASVPVSVTPDSGLHVLGVEAIFPDLIKTRKEIVFGGGFSEQMPAELTPVAVRLRTDTPDGPASCFRAGDRSLPAAPVERGEGAVHFIINGRRSLGRARDLAEPNELFSLGKNQILIVNPVAQEIARDGGHTYLFNSKSYNGNTGTRRVTINAQPPVGTAQIADAIGAAALRALRGGERRVVVLIVGDVPARDYSVHRPAIIRRYLARIGVPFRVWSLTGPRPDLVESWGEVRDVSTAAALLAATEDLRHELESQRVAWLPVGALEAFRVSATEDCAYVPLAGAGYALTPPTTLTPSITLTTPTTLTPGAPAASAP